KTCIRENRRTANLVSQDLYFFSFHHFLQSLAIVPVLLPVLSTDLFPPAAKSRGGKGADDKVQSCTARGEASLAADRSPAATGT
ncbi:hypothetical protein, partial [Agrobacterium pusense]|uniref:hypothetical protein n=1 Tax=Agrobacterium pusense TaxID=648995 RepID=UPI001AEC7658